jgi:hypothetical protein
MPSLALHHEGESSRTRVDVWLAKDYGLRSEYAEPDIALDPPTPSTLDLVSVLRAAAPHEPELASIERKAVVSLPLVASSGRWLGHLGIVDPEGHRRLSAPEHLLPLARPAAAELSRWTGARRGAYPRRPIVAGNVVGELSPREARGRPGEACLSHEGLRRRGVELNMSRRQGTEMSPGARRATRFQPVKFPGHGAGTPLMGRARSMSKLRRRTAWPS